jgi:tetratricopeptide (TPR) repeat protein
MAFVRVQGKQIRIMHTRRVGSSVRQERLHLFANPAEAAQVAASTERWKLFCDSLESSFSIELTPESRQQLKEKLEEAISGFPQSSEADPLSYKVDELLSILRFFKEPLTPLLARTLYNSLEKLTSLQVTIGEKIQLLNQSERTTGKKSRKKQLSAEELFEQGMAFYEQGQWDKARSLFLDGLQANPYDVDLHVHAGLIDLLEEHYDMALARFTKAVELGKPLADKLKATSKKKDHLYGHLELRPYFRALSNKAVTLMRMKRWHDAISAIQFARQYQPLNGTSNMIGECYAALGDFKAANEWFNEMQWEEAFFMKSLILFKVGQLRESIKFLLRGVTQNWPLAEMIVSRRKPAQNRYVGHIEGDMELTASECFHDSGSLFTGDARFRALVQTVLDDKEISSTIKGLDYAHQRRTTERDFKMPKEQFSLLYNGGDPCFAEEHCDRLLKAFLNPENPHWIPESHELVYGIVQKMMAQKWVISLRDDPTRVIHLQPAPVTRGEVGDAVKVFVFNSWIYRKQVHVTGRLESAAIPSKSSKR